MTTRSSRVHSALAVRRQSAQISASKVGCLFGVLILVAGCGGGSSSIQVTPATLPTPTFSVAAGIYTTAQSVSISEATAGATIYYTTNGNTPSTSSSVYSGPITVSATETLRAIAVETAYTNSAVASAAYTIAPVLPTPTFSASAGIYTTAQSVSISEATAGATIYYTTNGNAPTTSSSVYDGPITVSATETLQAIAVETGYTNSAVASAAYTISSVELKGKVVSGSSNVAGAEVQLYAVGSTGYGSKATALLSPAVTTDNDGNFVIATAELTCPSNSTLTYLVATGGDSGTGSNNSAIALMAALGACDSVSSIGSVDINEVTTVASVWALAPFLGSGSAGAELGTSSTNAQGLANAFANVNNLVDMSTGVSPGTSTPTSAVIPTAKINTLANILANCVNSDGTTACQSLFSYATPSGGTAPANTLDAALNIARNPSNNVASLFAITSSSSPFQPTLGTAPPDWTLAESYAGGGLDSPGSIAVDASGNVWAVNYFSSVTELSNTGQPLSPAAGFTGGDLNQSYGLALDGTGNVWVTNEDETSVNGGQGSVTELNSSGTVLSGTGGYYGGGVFFPVAVAADTDGSVWTANYGNSTASRLSSSGSAISGSAGFGVNQLAGPVAVAIDASHNAWFANQSSDFGSVTSISSDGSSVSTIESGGERTSGIATDSISTSSTVSGHVWTANFGSSSVSEMQLSNTGAASVVSTGYTGGGLNYPNGIAVDGAGNVWLANYYSAPQTTGATITELEGANSANPGAALSPSTGFGLDAGLLHPYGIAIDASGNVWVSNFGSSTITEFLGAATPVKTPLIGPAQLP